MSFIQMCAIEDLDRKSGTNGHKLSEVDNWPERSLGLESSVATPAFAVNVASFSAALKLSILMCAYNEQSTIVQAIAEILATKYPCDIELIVVDDGSTDATPELIKRINDPRVIFHRHPRNSGKGSALLSAVSLATGTYVFRSMLT